MLKILHIISSMNLINGGPAHGIINLNKTYKEKGLSLDVLCLEKNIDPSFFFDGINIITLNSFNLFNYYYCPDLDLWLKKNASNYSKIIINGIWQYHSFQAPRTLKKLNISYEIFIHGMLDPWSIGNSPFKKIKKTIYFYLFEYYSLKNAKNVIFTCEEEKRLASTAFKKIKFKAKIIRYGITSPPTQWLKSKLFLKKYPSAKNKKIILFLSRIHPKKGLDLLLHAFSILYKNNPHYILVIAGTGDISYINFLKKLSDKLGIADKIIWMGMVYGELKWSTFFSSDIFCLPSHQENFGIAIVESLSSGLPVLISNKVNIHYEISNHNAGIIFEDNLQGLISALREWNNLTKNELLNFKKNAKKCFTSNFLI
jgi:glycosyltransferase involved in cell wall biosynthesis